MWWQQHPGRMQEEFLMLKKHYPHVRFSLIKNASHRCLTCNSNRSNEPHLAVFADIPTFRGNHFPIAIVYPCNFPERIPSVWFVKPLDPTPNVHYFGNGRPCLTANEFDSSVTGVIVLGWTYDWLKSYEIWRKTGSFPDANYGQVRIR